MANQVFDQLIDQLKTAHLRAVFLWDGPSSWWQAALAEFTGSLSPSLSLGGEGHVEVTRYRDYLGQSYQQVVLDLSTGMNYDALAALHGTVAGGGCMHVILPASSPSTRRLRATAAGFETLLQLTPVDNIQSKLQTLLKAVAKYPERGRPAKPTEQQRAVITELLEHTNTPNILVADRGRGKSTAAGLAIHQLLQQEAAPNVVVTAPRRQAATTLLEHAGSTSHKLAFVAWDTLLRDNLNYTNQLLVIDEAGALPQHALKRLLAKFQVWIMTTTVDGYEGSGRGFAIRLQQQVTQTMNGRSHTLTEPMRWAANDPAELWLRTALLMNSSMHENQTTDVSTLQLQLCHASSLTERQLTDCFALLMEAHYQSSPNDLRLLLDDPQQQLLLALSQQQCIAVVWLSTEGPLPQSLHQPIVSGQRRPPGNLLPQSLAYHLQIPQVLAHKWLRVVRIVVDENQRQRGIGLRLLHECAAVAEATQCVALGTSFGGTNQLLKFWRAAGFSLVRQSHKLNMASGYAAVTMLKPLQPFTGELESLAVASELAQAERVWRQQSEPAVVPDFISHELVALLQRQLTAFVAGSLNLADIQFSLVLWAKFGGQLPASLQQLLRQPAPLADLAKHAGYNSQAELAKALRAHLQKLL